MLYGRLDSHGYTALHFACEQGSSRTIRALALAGADLNRCSSSSIGGYKTPLMICVTARQIQSCVDKTVYAQLTAPETARHSLFSPLSVPAPPEVAPQESVSRGSYSAPQLAAMARFEASMDAADKSKFLASTNCLVKFSWLRRRHKQEENHESCSTGTKESEEDARCWLPLNLNERCQARGWTAFMHASNDLVI